ncbi:MAG: MATE family efflux transporter [Christensenellaceae bacterium]|jgi:putative MATE family efflux protein|nr:MATE family efflux transporter [Christensenellaceae bacterium]
MPSVSKTRDMTSGSPLRHILLFMLPILLGSVFQRFYNVADAIVVGNALGSAELAAIGATGPATFFLLSIAMGLTHAFSIVTAQYFGANNEKMVRTTLVSGIYITAFCSLLFTITGLLAARPLLILLKTPAEILESSALYLRICIAGTLFQLVYNGAASALRAVGDSKTPLYFLLFACILNVTLDLIFALWLGWGLAGIACATVFSQFFAALLSVLYIFTRYPIFRLSRADLAPDLPNLAHVVKIGLPLGLQSLLVSVADMAIMSVVNSFGTNVLAAYTAYKRIQEFAMLSYNAIAQATSVFAGQNLGAGQPARIREGFKKIALVNIAIALLIVLGIFLSGDLLLRVFISPNDPQIDQIAAAAMEMLRIYASFYPVLCMILLYNNVLRGMGEVSIPLFSSLLELAVKICLSFGLAAVYGATGLWFAAPLSWVVAMIPSLWLYHSGRWQRRTAAFAEGGSVKA